MNNDSEKIVNNNFDKNKAEFQLSSNENYQAGWSFYLLLAAVITTVGLSLPVGYNIGVINTPAVTLQAFCNASLIERYGVELSVSALTLLWSSIVAMFVVGGCIGSLMGAWFADSFGRKGACLIIGCISLCTSVIFAFASKANSFEMLFVGRLIVGLAGGLTTGIVPMYLTELAPARLTGALGVLCPLGVNFGVLTGQLLGLDFLLGSPDQWHLLLSFYGVLVLVCLPILMLLPESPKYLHAIKKDSDGALQALAKTRGVATSLLNEEVAALLGESTNEAGTAQTWSLWKVFSTKSLRIPLLLVCSMQAGQQTSGINAVFNYSSLIFKNAGLSDTASQYATIGCGAINCVTAIMIVFILERCRRKPMLLGSIGSAVVALLVLAVSLQFLSTVPWMSTVCIIAALSYVCFYGFGLGPIPYFIASEMFEVGPRSGAMGLGSLANWIGNFLVTISLPTLQNYIGAYCFVIYAAITLGLFIFQKMCFYETKGKTPTEITQYYERKANN